MMSLEIKVETRSENNMGNKLANKLDKTCDRSYTSGHWWGTQLGNTTGQHCWGTRLGYKSFRQLAMPLWQLLENTTGDQYL